MAAIPRRVVAEFSGRRGIRDDGLLNPP